MNRRRHPRLDIDHTAILEYQGERFEPCRMLNFSRGGVYLQCSDPKLRALLPDGYFAEYERQPAELVIEPEGIKARVSIVYFRHQGLGVSLHENDTNRVFDALMASLPVNGAAVQTSSPEAGIDSQLMKKLLHQLKQKTAQYIDKTLPAFFTRAHDDLLARTEANVDSEEESALFFAINSLEQHRIELSHNYQMLVEQGFLVLMGEAKEAAAELPEELALVEKQEIDSWILVNDIAHRVESEVSGALYQLEAALSYLCQDNIRNELNPLSPISLLTAWHTVLDDYEMDIRSIRTILKAFQKTLLGDLNYLYAELLHQFRREGVAASQAQGIAHWSIVPAHEGSAERSMDRSIRHLTSLANLHHPTSGTEIQGGMPLAEQDEVMASLDALSQMQGMSILKQLEQQLTREAARPTTLPEAARAAIGAGEELVAALCSDPLVTPELHKLLDRLKLLIIQAVLQDPSLLENPEHAVRRLLNVIESIVPFFNTTRHPSLVRERDQAQFADIVKSIETGQISHVDEVTRELLALQQDQHERFEKNRELAISRCEQDECLKQAHASTYEVLAEQLLGRSVSIAIDKLFEFGWANLLVQTLVLAGEESASWKAYLCVIDILMKLFAQDKSPQEIQDKQIHDLISLIRRGFRDYPVYPEGAKRFAIELQKALTEDRSRFERFVERRLQIDETYLQRQFRGMRGQRSPVVDEADSTQHWLELVDGLGTGDWLLMKQRAGGNVILNLAWKNQSSNRYLLVDGEGFKSLDVTRESLARSFAEGEVQVMEHQLQSITDRAIDRILSSSYNEVRDESAIDSLTGLMNRRAFELELRQRLADISASEIEHVLVLLDLDKFQAVNDLCGFEGGDSLLGTISDILVSYLPDDGMVARIGDDEFALLLKGYSLEQGYQTSEILRQAIDAYQFNWEGRLIPVSASVGLVQVESAEQTTNDLLQAAMAANIMAKQGGRNCTRIYLSSDSAYQDQQLMVQSLPAIKAALAKGRMVLFAQPIVPLQGGRGLRSHYEILLRIQNEAGELESPQDFVRAAEHYDMMRAVDRWVVDAFFSAVAPYVDIIDSGMGFSINLSGKSMGDREFKEYIKQEIVRTPMQSIRLGFEITETALVDDIREAALFIEEIRELGCSFSLDDFGSGYASFSYLKDFPVDFVKIDGVFVREILNKPADYAMINSITEIAHFMDKQVIAEFVSSAEIAQALISIGVDYAQGYHYGKPRPLSEILSQLAPAQLKDTGAD
jgi:diguanylate cyclase (GGDEF)-like protein